VGCQVAGQDGLRYSALHAQRANDISEKSTVRRTIETSASAIIMCKLELTIGYAERLTATATSKVGSYELPQAASGAVDSVVQRRLAELQF